MQDRHRVSRVWKVKFCSETFAVCGSVCVPKEHLLCVLIYIWTLIRKKLQMNAQTLEKAAVNKVVNLKTNS